MRRMDRRGGWIDEWHTRRMDRREEWIDEENG